MIVKIWLTAFEKISVFVQVQARVAIYKIYRSNIYAAIKKGT